MMKKFVVLLIMIGFLSIITSCSLSKNDVEINENSGTNGLETDKLSRTHISKNDVKNYIYDYINAYIKPITANGISGYYVHNPGLGNAYHPAHISSSEAMGYGMRIVLHAYSMARTNREKDHWKSMFEGLWRVANKVSARGTCNCCITDNLSPNSYAFSPHGSTTGDMEIAYALIMAHKLLGSSNIGGDDKNYKWHAKNKLIVMALYNTQTYYISSLDYSFTFLLIGNKHQEPENYWLDENDNTLLNYKIDSDLVTKPSDWNIHYFAVFLDFLKEDNPSQFYDKTTSFYKFQVKPWQDLRISAAIMFTIDPFDNGMFPDFIKFELDGGEDSYKVTPLDPTSLEAIYMIGENMRTNIMSYSSCRVPLNLAMAYEYTRWSTPRYALDRLYKTLHPGYDITETGKEYYLNGSIKQHKFSSSFAGPIATTSLSRRYEGAWQSNKAAYYRIGRDTRILINKFKGSDPDPEKNGFLDDSLNLFSLLLLTEYQYVPYK